LEKKNKKIELQQIVDGEEIRVESNYLRELLYNLEHCIHHQALIKLAVLQNPTILLSENFEWPIQQLNTENNVHSKFCKIS
jgi:hypothetical protein